MGDSMTEALKEVVEQIQHLAEQLGPAEQETFAQALLERIKELEEEAERGWHQRFSDPRALDAIDRLAEEAHQEYLAGETVDLDEVLRAIPDE